MKISGNMTMTKFDGIAVEFEPVAVCLTCLGIVHMTTRDGIGRCRKCDQEYEVSFIAVLKAVG